MILLISSFLLQELWGSASAGPPKATVTKEHKENFTTSYDQVLFFGIIPRVQENFRQQMKTALMMGVGPNRFNSQLESLTF